MRFVGAAFRVHDPKWAFSPVSGDGAAVHGGRFNPKGMPALYLALTVEGAVIEASQGFANRLQPLTICEYDVDCENIADLRDAAGCKAAGVDPADLASPWMLDLLEGREPASWRLARRLIAQGQAGLIAPSFATYAKPAAANLVLWNWSAEKPHRVRVVDPEGRLPKDQKSWE